MKKIINLILLLAVMSVPVFAGTLTVWYPKEIKVFEYYWEKVIYYNVERFVYTSNSGIISFRDEKGNIHYLSSTVMWEYEE